MAQARFPITPPISKRGADEGAPDYDDDHDDDCAESNNAWMKVARKHSNRLVAKPFPLADGGFLEITTIDPKPVYTKSSAGNGWMRDSSTITLKLSWWGVESVENGLQEILHGCTRKPWPLVSLRFSMVRGDGKEFKPIYVGKLEDHATKFRLSCIGTEGETFITVHLNYPPGLHPKNPDEVWYNIRNAPVGELGRTFSLRASLVERRVAKAAKVKRIYAGHSFKVETYLQFRRRCGGADASRGSKSAPTTSISNSLEEIQSEYDRTIDSYEGRIKALEKKLEVAESMYDQLRDKKEAAVALHQIECEKRREVELQKARLQEAFDALSAEHNEMKLERQQQKGSTSAELEALRQNHSRLQHDQSILLKDLAFYKGQLDAMARCLEGCSSVYSTWKRKRDEFEEQVNQDNIAFEQEATKRQRQSSDQALRTDVDDVLDQKDDQPDLLTDPPSGLCLELLDEAGFNLYYDDDMNDRDYADATFNLVQAVHNDLADVQAKVNEAYKKLIDKKKKVLIQPNDFASYIVEIRKNRQWLNDWFLPHLKANYSNFIVQDEDETDPEVFEEKDGYTADFFYKLFSGFF